jgi:hypothetical protein
MGEPPAFNVLLVTDRDERVLEPGQVTPVDGDVEAAWLPVRCDGCGENVLARGRQRGRADVDMTATSHRAECRSCGLAIRAVVEYLHDQYRTWQPLVPDDVEHGEVVHVADLADRVD